MSRLPSLSLRRSVKPSDRKAVRSVVQSSGFFSPAETAIALELLDEHVNKGERSGYMFLFADLLEELVGYSCFGPISGTQSSYDLYWIAVLNDFRSRGIGRTILQETEQIIFRSGGRRIYVETSGRDQYRLTRLFYSRHAYAEAARLKDFYGAGDDKVIYVKIL
ncbi:GNAT family N-acetyltransferase [Desulfoferrobacter suflitae]|uniref:GNAT family N-acetyltransferase n=1 Tax=Desulfoferrobacter suflitae TaxID=2865782 RepID=UPI002164DE03|nr:GNAT family N-acetyltransferase [Desulfoferrobacter suflitae]MCK8601196.1 GNAT family N-acetyltransferase [Desulfoferrobacter suflitae]